MLSIELARALRDAGLQWTPTRGDVFVMPDRDMDADVFVLSDMTIEVHEYPGGPVIRFNGTTEWALDSVELDEALWVPAEHQLRERLGDAFAGLAPTSSGYRVTLRVDGATSGYDGADPVEAYALALLDVLTSRARGGRDRRSPSVEERPMAGSGPDPGEFLERAQRVLRELFGETRDDDPWGQATRARGPSSEQRRENLTFALATRAVEALEDLALNVAAIRQRLERLDTTRGPDGGDAGQ